MVRPPPLLDRDGRPTCNLPVSVSGVKLGRRGANLQQQWSNSMRRVEACKAELRAQKEAAIAANGFDAAAAAEAAAATLTKKASLHVRHTAASVAAATCFTPPEVPSASLTRAAALQSMRRTASDVSLARAAPSLPQHRSTSWSVNHLVGHPSAQALLQAQQQQQQQQQPPPVIAVSGVSGGGSGGGSVGGSVPCTPQSTPHSPPQALATPQSPVHSPTTQPQSRIPRHQRSSRSANAPAPPATPHQPPATINAQAAMLAAADEDKTIAQQGMNDARDPERHRVNDAQGSTFELSRVGSCLDTRSSTPHLYLHAAPRGGQ